MPVDSIITTIITSVMVKISTGSKTGAAIPKGSTNSNQEALATLSKFMNPIATLTTPPTTMPSSTEMLEMKPLPYLAISRMDASTSAAMPTPLRSAYLGLGTLAARARPLGMAGTLLPAALAAVATSASHLACSGFTTLGAVGPKGLPKIQLMPTRIRLMPITAMMVPVTTGGK